MVLVLITKQKKQTSKQKLKVERLFTEQKLRESESLMV